MDDAKIAKLNSLKDKATRRLLRSSHTQSKVLIQFIQMLNWSLKRALNASPTE